MFEKVSQAAEKLATGVSRRGFLGSVGRWAGATALGLAGVLTTAGAAQAGKPLYTCCVYRRFFFSHYNYCYVCVKQGSPCPSTSAGCPNYSFSQSYTVTDCKTQCTAGGYIGP